MSATILLIEDNPHIMTINRKTLGMAGYRVLEAETVSEGRALFEKENPDLIVLDILLPDGDGLSFCEELRGDSKTPILFLTALGQKQEKIAGLRAGGDDYLPKPYDIDELVERIDALLRRAGYVPEVITKGNLTVKIPSNEAFINDKNLQLSPKEFSLLVIFMQNENRLFSDDYLYGKVWGRPMLDDKQAVQTAVSRLRRKIVNAGYDIANIKGKGYIFDKN